MQQEQTHRALGIYYINAMIFVFKLHYYFIFFLHSCYSRNNENTAKTQNLKKPTKLKETYFKLHMF